MADSKFTQVSWTGECRRNCALFAWWDRLWTRLARLPDGKLVMDVLILILLVGVFGKHKECATFHRQFNHKEERLRETSQARGIHTRTLWCHAYTTRPYPPHTQHTHTQHTTHNYTYTTHAYRIPSTHTTRARHKWWCTACRHAHITRTFLMLYVCVWRYQVMYKCTRKALMKMMTCLLGMSLLLSTLSPLLIRVCHYYY